MTESELDVATTHEWGLAVVGHEVDPQDTDTDEPTCAVCGVHVDLYMDGWDHAREDAS